MGRRSTTQHAIGRTGRSVSRGAAPVLSDQLPGLTAAVPRLNDEATNFPAEVAESLVGSGGPLRAAVRSRLRLVTADRHRRDLVSLSIATRLAESDSRCVGSSVDVAFRFAAVVGQSRLDARTKNLAAQRGAEEDIRDGLRRRSAAAVADRLGPLAARFRDELAAMRRDRAATQVAGTTTSHVPKLPILPGSTRCKKVHNRSLTKKSNVSRCRAVRHCDSVRIDWNAGFLVLDGGSHRRTCIEDTLTPAIRR